MKRLVYHLILIATGGLFNNLKAQDISDKETRLIGVIENKVFLNVYSNDSLDLFIKKIEKIDNLLSDKSEKWVDMEEENKRTKELILLRSRIIEEKNNYIKSTNKNKTK